MNRVAPLIARMVPIPGETLLSLVARAAHANVFPRLADLFGHAGADGHPAFSPFTLADRAQPLADLLGVPVEDVVSRLHPPHPDQRPKGAVVWAGVRIRRRSIEARARRVAPLALKLSPYHRLEWTHRALSFCPETLQQLISACPACGVALGWVTTKGLDRCERCDASLTDAESPLVQTRSPDRLRAAARLISPDAAIRAAALKALPPEFHAWDAGDLFAALCELGFAWRRPERVSHALGRGLADGSHRFKPEDLARGHTLLHTWPALSGELLERLATGSSAHRLHGRLTAGHLGLLARHSTPVATGRTLGGLLMRAMDAEAESRRTRSEQSKLEDAALAERKVGSIGLVEACRVYGVSRPVLSRLVPHGRSLVAVQARRQGGIRFNEERLSATVVAHQSSESVSLVARQLGLPRYGLPALVDAGVLAHCGDPDVDLLFGEGSVTARSWAELQQALSRNPTGRRMTFGLRGLGACLRRRFDPAVWAAALKLVLDDERIHKLTAEDDGRALLDRIYVQAEMLLDRLPVEDCSRLDPGLRLTAGEVGRVLGIAPPHLPELVGEGVLKGVREPQGWAYRLGDVLAFHKTYVTGPELRQRHASSLKSLFAHPCAWDQASEPQIRLTDYAEVISTRHFALALRAEVEAELVWPHPELN